MNMKKEEKVACITKTRPLSFLFLQKGIETEFLVERRENESRDKEKLGGRSGGN